MSLKPSTTTEAAAQAPAQGIPSVWPGAFGAYKYSKEAVKFNFVTIFMLIVAALLIHVVLYSLVGNEVLYNLLSSIVLAYFTVSFILTFIAAVRRQKLDVAQALKVSPGLFVKMLVLTLLLDVILAFSILLLIIPAIFVLPRVTLSPYYLVDKNLGIIDALKAGWKAGGENFGRIWGIVGVTVLMALLVLTIIGIPIAIYLLLMYAGVTAVLYEHVNKKQPVA